MFDMVSEIYTERLSRIGENPLNGLGYLNAAVIPYVRPTESALIRLVWDRTCRFGEPATGLNYDMLSETWKDGKPSPMGMVTRAIMSKPTYAHSRKYLIGRRIMVGDSGLIRLNCFPHHVYTNSRGLIDALQKRPECELLLASMLAYTKSLLELAKKDQIR